MSYGKIICSDVVQIKKSPLRLECWRASVMNAEGRQIHLWL